MSGLTLWAIKRMGERIGCGRERVARLGTRTRSEKVKTSHHIILKDALCGGRVISNGFCNSSQDLLVFIGKRSDHEPIELSTGLKPWLSERYAHPDSNSTS